MSLSDFYYAMFTSSSEYNVHRSIITKLRLPRTFSTILVGAALSVSGLIYQELFQNKLVSPDLLGVSNGAGFGAAFGIVLGLSMAYVGFFSFLFALLTVGLTLLIARAFRQSSPMILLLSGIIVGGFMSSALSMVKFFADQETTLAQITFWLMGSFSQSRLSDLYYIGPIVIIGLFFLVLFRHRINVIALGKEEAQTSGLAYNQYKISLIVIVTLMTAICISFYGTISWVGLVIPHLVRLFVGRETKYSIPLTITIGASFMLLTDIISRSFTASEIPISAVTGLIGTPIFIIVLLLKEKDVV